MRALHRPASQVQRASGWPRLRAAPLAVGFARNRHGVGVQEALIAAIGQGQPGENIDLFLAGRGGRGAVFRALDLRDIIGLPVKACGHIGERELCRHRAVALRDHRQCRLGRQILRQPRHIASVRAGRCSATPHNLPSVCKMTPPLGPAVIIAVCSRVLPVALLVRVSVTSRFR